KWRNIWIRSPNPHSLGFSRVCFLDRLLDAVADGIKRIVPVAVLFKVSPALTPLGQWTERREEFAVVLEIHRIKNHWHYLNLAVLVAHLRFWQFHVLDVVGGEKMITDQAEKNV